MEHPEFMGKWSFFNDNGNHIDPLSVPIPELCLRCRINEIDDPEENLLCLMTRFDQMEEKDFLCYAFESD
jgi:hypothetical protein